MLKLTKILGVLLITGVIFTGCSTEVAEFDNLKDAVETAKEESKDVEQDETNDIDNESDIITIENDSEFKSLLESQWKGSESAKWFNDNLMKVIEFDGSIEAMDLIAGKKTRYTMVIGVGDYNPDSYNGPTFLVRDFGAADPAVRELIRSSKGEVGVNIKVKAKCYGYYKNSDAIEIKLESVEVR